MEQMDVGLWRCLAQETCQDVSSCTTWSVSTRPTSATPSLAAPQSRPPSASKEASEWTSSPISSAPEPLRSVLAAPSASSMQQALSEDFQIEEDYSEDNGLEEEIERMRAGRAGRTARPCPEQPEQPEQCEPCPVPLEPKPPSPSVRSQGSQGRPKSADHRMKASHGASTGFDSARSRRPRSVVAEVRCDQVISRHLPEREVQSKMISVLARQLERLRDCIPAFAAQWQAVEAYMQKEQHKVAEKVREVQALQEDTRMMQKMHSQQYELLLRGLQRKVDEAKSSWQKWQHEMEASAHEEYELHRKIVATEEQSRSLRDALDKTWKQMEDVQQVVLQGQSILEARAQGNWSMEDPSEEPTAAAELRHMEQELKRHIGVREQIKLCHAQLEEADKAMAEQHAYAARLEQFIRKISGGGGRYVLPTALKREAQRHLKMASVLQANAVRDGLLQEQP